MANVTTASNTSAAAAVTPDLAVLNDTAHHAACPPLDRSLLDVTSDSWGVGSEVNVSCRAFGHRVQGAPSLTCNASAQWQPKPPACQWTWDLTTQEKVIFGTAVGCAALFIIILIATLIACYCSRQQRRKNKEKEYDMYGENPGYTPAEDSEGLYPDAYFAYQEVGEKQINGTTTDRAWLGYIPRPKVAEGHYYHH